MMTLRKDRLSLAMSGLQACADVRDTSARGLIEWIGSRGVRFVQLDAAMAGMRARELGRSARRDIAALVKRVGLSISGLDLWVPAAHFVDPANQQRAIDATIGACELAAQLRSILGDAGGVAGNNAGFGVSLSLHEETPGAVLDAIGAAASRAGVFVFDHAWPMRSVASDSPIRVAIDPAVLIGAGASVAKAVLSASPAPGAFRLSDFSAIGRVAAGGGSLDLAGYDIALTTINWGGAVTLDIRGLREAAAVDRVIQRLSDSASSSGIVKFE
ncbi:MAG: hypothetical protein IT434_09730 [Phycisphaerales bacterium]|jgi:sugar phosphate isomerase/epimerase|nr:hypothetical protein [Phycisphaerales bacterium]